MVLNNLIYISITLCLLQFSLANNSDMQELKNQQSRSKNNVMWITSDIKRFTAELQFSTNSKINVPVKTTLRKIGSMGTPFVTQISKDVDEAVRKGKNPRKATECLDKAVGNFMKAAEHEDSDLNKCQEGSKQMVLPEIHALMALFSRGNQLVGELDSVFSRCAGGNTFKVQRCITVLLQNINKNIGSYESSAVDAKKHSEVVIKNAVDFLNTCISHSLETIRTVIAKLKQEAARCLQNVQQKPK